ncbi:MAG: DgaE family pyridoxal phosphate-dependent ammonia lyase [Firmicutes bacterium]|nr:DgaE family pyridoxal phosphate-dependent ammonia lyase [Bacillota bacterium]
MSVYTDLGLKQVINASGKMTALGGSAVAAEVAEAMARAARDYVSMEDLFRKAGQKVATLIGAEAACITSGAAAGIAISIAACIAGRDLALIERLPDSGGLRNEVLLPKGHSVNFGAPLTQVIRLGGGRPVEVGQVNEVKGAHLQGAVSDRTAALLYVKSHHTVQKGIIPLEEMVRIGKEKGIPVVVDAAAEEDLRKYLDLGADLVIYSGGKAIEGPTSGFICGRKDLIEACQMQYRGVGRAMKIGKEGILGLLAALDRYLNRDRLQDAADQRKRMEWLIAGLQDIPHLEAGLTQDEAGREIYRAQIRIDEKGLGLTAKEVIKLLEGGDPAIYTRNHFVNLGIISIDPRPLLPGQEAVVLRRLHEIFAEATPPCNPRSCG